MRRTMYITEFQAKNCPLPNLLRYCKWLESKGKFDSDYLDKTRAQLVAMLQFHGYVENKAYGWS